MPNYDYKCEEHGEFEGFDTLAHSGDPKPCITCKKPARRIIITSKGEGGRYSHFEAHWNENVHYDPVFITSRRQLREICKRNGLIPRGYAGSFKGCSR